MATSIDITEPIRTLEMYLTSGVECKISFPAGGQEMPIQASLTNICTVVYKSFVQFL